MTCHNRSVPVRWQKNGSLGFAKGRLCVQGKSQMCQLCGGLKEILKNAKGGLFLFFLSTVPTAKVGQPVCPSLGRDGLYVESIFSHCLAVSSVFLALVAT